MGKHKKKDSGRLDQQAIIKQYHVTKPMIRKYFPKPELLTIRTRHGGWYHMGFWSQETVEEVMQLPELREELEKLEREREENRMMEEIRQRLEDYSPDALIERAKSLRRTFVLHVGPTNSGKTYEAIEDLKRHTPGTYLGPLRLLALEMFDKINAAGIPCSMLTGEESIPVEGAEIVSSTIELCDYTRRFKTAVIDEAQLVADPDRGAAWLRAICLVDAEVVHICMAPEALHFVEGLIQRFSDAYSIVRHKRLAPLRYAGSIQGYEDLRPDDTLICFSRKSVLSTAALLERNGFRASVIYGALPPEARRNEVHKYLTGETNVVVATDAIGMGISLPIKRVIFTETEKFDGKEFRTLNTAEVNQIGGRAGRYGLNEYGEVLVLGESPVIEERLGHNVRDIKSACVAFPREMLATDYPIRLLLRAWQSMPRGQGFIREDMHDAEQLLRALGRLAKADRELLPRGYPQ